MYCIPKREDIDFLFFLSQFFSVAHYSCNILCRCLEQRTGSAITAVFQDVYWLSSAAGALCVES